MSDQTCGRQLVGGPCRGLHEIGGDGPNSQWPIDSYKATKARIKEDGVQSGNCTSKQALRKSSHREEGGKFKILGSKVYGRV
jgi:hypothetical protein